MIPILDKFIETAKGNVDKIFWSNIYKQWDRISGQYGGQETINGWILNFFPYKGKNQSKFAKRSLEQMQGDIYK